MEVGGSRDFAGVEPRWDRRQLFLNAGRLNFWRFAIQDFDIQPRATNFDGDSTTPAPFSIKIQR